MANVEATVTVSLEAAIIDGLKNLANEVSKNHGVKIRDVRFEWMDMMGEPARAMHVDVNLSKEV